MSLQELKGGDDAQELLAHVVALDVDRVDDVVVVAVVGVVRLGAAVDEGLEAFEEVAEKVDVDEVEDGYKPATGMDVGAVIVVLLGSCSASSGSWMATSWGGR